jgi:hypothetical protein
MPKNMLKFIWRGEFEYFNNYILVMNLAQIILSYLEVPVLERIDLRIKILFFKQVSVLKRKNKLIIMH